MVICWNIIDVRWSCSRSNTFLDKFSVSGVCLELHTSVSQLIGTKPEEMLLRKVKLHSRESARKTKSRL